MAGASFKLGCQGKFPPDGEIEEAVKGIPGVSEAKISHGHGSPDLYVVGCSDIKKLNAATAKFQVMVVPR